MKFKSTRGSVSGVSFEDAVLSGCPSDGGLFVPETLPRFSREEMRAWSSLSYPQLVERLLHVYVDEEEMSDQDIKSKGGGRDLTGAAGIPCYHSSSLLI